MIELTELDLTVFENIFDPHNKGKLCLNVIEGIKTNKHTRIKGKLSEHNQELLLQYAGKMIDRVKEDNFTIASLEKNLSEAWKLCLFFGNKNIEALTPLDLARWWETELKRYRGKEISFGTMQKLNGTSNTFLKYVKCPKKWGTSAARKMQVEQMSEIWLPNKPKPKLKERLPTQKEVKKLFEEIGRGVKCFLPWQIFLVSASEDYLAIHSIH